MIQFLWDFPCVTILSFFTKKLLSKNLMRLYEYFEIRKKSNNRGTWPVQCTLTALLEFWVCSHDPISIQFTIGDDKHQKNVGHKRTDFYLRNLCHYTIDNKNTCYFETNASLGDFICIFFLSITFLSSMFKYSSS